MRRPRTIIFAPEAAKEFDELDSTVKEQVETALERLALDPFALCNQIKRLKGHPALRLRTGDWRFIFQIQGHEIVVLTLAHRRDACRSER